MTNTTKPDLFKTIYAKTLNLLNDIQGYTDARAPEIFGHTKTFVAGIMELFSSPESTGPKIHIEIKGLPATTNSMGRAHFRVKVKQARNWKAYVRNSLLLNCPHFPHEDMPWDKAKLTLIRNSSNEPDFDGLVSSFKHVIDGLIEAGCIKNDKRENIGQPTYLWKKAKPKSGSIEIIVERI